MIYPNFPILPPMTTYSDKRVAEPIFMPEPIIAETEGERARRKATEKPNEKKTYGK